MNLYKTADGTCVHPENNQISLLLYQIEPNKSIKWSKIAYKRWKNVFFISHCCDTMDLTVRCFNYMVMIFHYWPVWLINKFKGGKGVYLLRRYKLTYVSATHNTLPLFFCKHYTPFLKGNQHISNFFTYFNGNFPLF